MKRLVVICVLLCIDALCASPVTSRGNEKHRWNLLPDSEGNIHLIDLNPLEAVSVEPLFNAETDTAFLLLTRRNPTVFQRIFMTRESIEASNFDASHETRFTIHGWNGDSTARVNTFVAFNYFQHDEYNMITVDWSIGGNTINYITARNRVGAVATVVARFIDFLHENSYLRFHHTHVIGHSLGGQIAGLTGKTVSRGKIQVIMALDPAGPLFNFDDPTGRVASTDGVYVEIIHTNIDRLGFDQPIGQADFFPNFGRVMPGCESDLTGQCSHSRSHIYYAESINTPFTADECTSFADIASGRCTPTGRRATMGGPNGNIGLTGNYYLETNADTPFSRG